MYTFAFASHNTALATEPSVHNLFVLLALGSLGLGCASELLGSVLALFACLNRGC